MKICLIGVGGGIAAAVECWRWGGSLQRKARAPNEPWLWRADWVRGEVVFSTFFEVAIRWTLVLLVGGVLSGFAYLVFREDLGEFFRHWTFGALNVFVLGFVIVACIETRRWMRLGRSSTFRLGTIPGRVNGKLAGVLNIAQRPTASNGFAVVLTCTRTVMQGDEAQESQLHALVPVEPLPLIPQNAGRNRLELPLTFQIPTHAPPTQDDSPSVQWVLTVKACADGDDFEVHFEVPVYA